MEKDEFDNLKSEVSKYNLTKKRLNSFLEDLKDLVLTNSELIINSNKEDVKVTKKQVKIEEFINIINSYRNYECKAEDNEKKLVIYKGDPYLTLHICLQALARKVQVTLMHEEFMLGVNEVLLNLINKSLKDYKIYNLIYDEKNYSVNRMKEIKKQFSDVVIIGDTTIYQSLNIEKNVKYYPYNNIMLYCENEEFKELQEAIYIYANENQYETEILYENNINEAIDIINSDEFVDTAILLTKNDESKEKFELNIKNKEIYINNNPFKKQFGKVYNYLG